MFADTISYIHWKTKFSKILLSTGVREIALPASFRLLTLGKGRTFAHFQSGGIWPWAIDALKIEQIGAATKVELSFNTQFGI